MLTMRKSNCLNIFSLSTDAFVVDHDGDDVGGVVDKQWHSTEATIFLHPSIYPPSLIFHCLLVQETD